jgi:thiamine biosynthesis lipoprotein
MKFKKELIFVIILLIGLTSCNYENEYTTEDFAMGTLINQKIYSKNGEEITQKVIQEIENLENILSVNIETSEVTNINKNAGKKSVKVSEETFDIIKTALDVSKKSEGAFDITVYPIVNLWGIGTENQKKPSDEEIENLLPLVNYKDIVLDDNEKTVYLKNINQEIDLGGIAKGYAGDVSKEIYIDEEVSSGIINFGGNVVTLGKKTDGEKFKIGIQNPRENTGIYLGILEVEEKAVVTSGDYERYFEEDGVRYHHIIDPETGKPSESDLMSVTIVTESSVKADALSTASFVLGLEKGLELINDYSDVEAIFITDDKEILVTEGIMSDFTFNDESGNFKYEKR